MLRWIRLAAFTILVVILTALTQVGGLILLASWAVCHAAVPRRAGGLYRLTAVVVLFVVFYAVATFFVIPPLAKIGGRVPLSCSSADKLTSATTLLCVLNRHYVSPRMKTTAEAFGADVARAYPGAITLTLDGNFPFIDGFPLPPHLSHDDGLKLDFAYYYLGPDSTYLPGRTRSSLGYFAFEQPRENDPEPCAGRADIVTLRWDLDWLQPLFQQMTLDEARTAYALKWLVEIGPSHGVSRVFVEPHVATRLGVASPILRFQGCRAARHDDHIHVEIEP